MRITYLIFLVIFDLILLAICVGYGEFPGFVVWLVLSFVGFYANRHYSLKTAEVLLKVEREQRKRAPEPMRPQLPASTEDVWRVQLADGEERAMTVDQLDAAYQDGVIDDDTMLRRDSERRWVRLRDRLGETARADATRTQRQSRAPANKGADRHFVRCAECDAKNNASRETCWQCKNPLRVGDESAADPNPRAKRLRKMAAQAGPVCPQCGSLNDDDAEHCTACGKRL